jgi:hypothetical protein
LPTHLDALDDEFLAVATASGQFNAKHSATKRVPSYDRNTAANIILWRNMKDD